MLDLSARVISRGITWHALCFSSSLSCGGRQADPALSLVNPSSLSPQSVPGHPSCSPHETIPPYLAAGNRERERETVHEKKPRITHTNTQIMHKWYRCRCTTTAQDSTAATKSHLASNQQRNQAKKREILLCFPLVCRQTSALLSCFALVCVCDVSHKMN